MTDEIGFDIENEISFIKLAFEDAPDVIYIFEVSDYKKIISKLIISIIDSDLNVINNDKPILLKCPDNTINIADTLEAFDFIKQYIDIYSKVEEYDKPPKPISKLVIAKWFEDENEKKIFEPYYINIDSIDNITDELQKQLDYIYNKLKNIAILTNYFDMDILLNKICCLIANIISITSIKK